MNHNTDGREIKRYGVMCDGSMNVTTKGQFLDRLVEREEYLGTYAIKWIDGYKDNVLVSSDNMQFVAFVEWEVQGE